MTQLKLSINKLPPKVKVGQILSITGTASVTGGEGSNVIDSVTVALDTQPPIGARLPRPPKSTVNFKVDFQVPDTPEKQHFIYVTATDDGGGSIQDSVSVFFSNDRVSLQRMSITFHTHDDDRDPDTILHVFVKNRSSTTATSDGGSDYISNLLAFERFEQEFRDGKPDKNPYLGYGKSLSEGRVLDDGSTHTFDIDLRTMPVPLEEVVLPAVNIHILPKGDDTWRFDYSIAFYFDDDRWYSYSSTDVGLDEVILDRDNRDHYGICVENPFNAVPFVPAFDSASVLTGATLRLHTHDSEKAAGTKVAVKLFNRLPDSSMQLLAEVDVVNEAFGDGTVKEIALPISVGAVRQTGLALPVVRIDTTPPFSWDPAADPTWRFDYELTLVFSGDRRPPQDDPPASKSRTGGVNLLQTRRGHHIGVYQGPPFPASKPRGKPTFINVPGKAAPPRKIPLAYLRARIDEFIHNRADNPITKIIVGHTPLFGHTLPESYFSLQSIVASPPAPGTLSLPGFEMPVSYIDSPRSLGPSSIKSGIGATLPKLTRSKILVEIDPKELLPITLHLDFDRNPDDDVGISHMSVRISLTVGRDVARNAIDVLAWVPPGMEDDEIVKRALDVKIVPDILNGLLEAYARGKIFEMLSKQDPFDGKTLRDKLNETFTSLLVGGSIEGEGRVKVSSAGFKGDELVIDYETPAQTFELATPAQWPPQDFTPGNLSNIDHIVVLTMENRSFDSMLGYLSLPAELGGQGRPDVDGLRGGEFNRLGDKVCPSFAFLPFDTIFSPDPPHGYEPVRRAINGGAMSGFVQSFADEHGPDFAPRIMGFHTGANLPTYDALARDFMICDRWFASHPGPTFCNRFYELTGRLSTDDKGFWEFDNSGPLRMSFTPTIFDHLTDGGVSWKYFEHHYCYLRLFQKYTFDFQNIVAFDDPVAGFEAAARDGSLPSVTFVDPHFIELPPGANCDGAPADVKAGQALVRRVVEAVVGGPKWDKTLLIIVYDEHGGFYDHVAPPAAPWICDNDDEPIGTTGVRVPMILVSPWAQAGKAFGSGGRSNVGAYYDHTSILKTIARRFLSKKPPYMGKRYEAALDLSPIVGSQRRGGPFLPFVPYHLFYDATHKRLAVSGAATAPGAGLLQADPNDDISQRFSVEDAGDGLFCLRTHTGNLYLTVSETFAVTQQHKSASPTQRWSLTPNSDGTRFTIRNAAFPDKVLRPSGTSAGAAVVLGDPPQPGLRSPDQWQVTRADRPERANTLSIGTTVGTYTTLDSVSVVWTGLPGNPKDWVAIVPSGAPATAALLWTYTGGEVAGSAAFSVVTIGAGSYVARALSDDSYTVLAESQVFTITAAIPATVFTDKQSYARGESIQLHWTGLRADINNWVGYAPAGSPNSMVTRWASAGGQTAGSLLLEGPVAPGQYVARAFGDDSYKKAGESAVFSVA